MKKDDYSKLFKELGAKYRILRSERNMVQEDAIEYDFSVRHYQQLEAGRPHSLTTLFRLAEMFDVEPTQLLKELKGGKKGKQVSPKRKK
jgi:transcriptional regulator with XRE-family HTH domain